MLTVTIALLLPTLFLKFANYSILSVSCYSKEMGAAYRVELRERALAAIDKGMSKWEVHKTFKISRSTIDDWLNLREEKGTIVAQTDYKRGPKPAIADTAETESFFEEHKHKTLAQLCALWFQKTGKRVSDVTMSKTLRRLGYSRKKRATVIKNEMN